MNGPENTTADRELNALGMLAVGSSAYITAQESAGQRQLVASTSLPTDTNGNDEAFLTLGFTFGEPNPTDPMFRPATLPEGWSKERSDHDMWSYVVDDLGRERVAVFYKAAFYDRRAFMRLETVAGYALKLAYDEAEPVFDDTWCTRPAFAEAIGKRRAEIVDRIALYEGSDAAWAASSLEDTRQDLVKLDAWAARVGGA